MLYTWYKVACMLTTSEQEGGKWGWLKHSKVFIHFSRWWEIKMVSLGKR